MTTLTPAGSDADEDGPVTWAQVESGFHVGSRDGAFVGYIDRRPDGTFLASDEFSREVGGFDDLKSAMAALSTPGGAR